MLEVEQDGAVGTTGPVRIVLDGSLSVAFAEAIRTRLRTELVPERDAEVVLNVDRLDASGVQLLLAARNWLARNGRALTVVVPDGPARRALATSGALSTLIVREPGADSPSTAPARHP